VTLFALAPELSRRRSKFDLRIRLAHSAGVGKLLPAGTCEKLPVDDGRPVPPRDDGPMSQTPIPKTATSAIASEIQNLRGRFVALRARPDGAPGETGAPALAKRRSIVFRRLPRLTVSPQHRTRVVRWRSREVTHAAATSWVNPTPSRG
jgi:hypothetical protein